PANVTQFISPAESLAGADLVVYYGIQFHHIPRDEDESKMHAHWSTFRIQPRDWNDHTLPEPGGALPLALGALLLGALRKRNAYAARQRGPHALDKETAGARELSGSAIPRPAHKPSRARVDQRGPPLGPALGPARIEPREHAPRGRRATRLGRERAQAR